MFHDVSQNLKLIIKHLTCQERVRLSLLNGMSRNGKSVPPKKKQLNFNFCNNLFLQTK